MSSYSRIVTLDGRTAASVKAWFRLIPGFHGSAISRISSYFADIGGGVHAGRLTIATTALQATGTATFTGVDAGDTFVVAGVTFTAVASGATGNQFNVGASDTATAANAVVAINASTTNGLNSMVTASSAAAIVTITSNIPGYIGNMVTMATNDAAEVVLSGANLTGGSEDANVVMYNGI